MADLSLLLAQQAYLLTQKSEDSADSDLWDKVSPVLAGPFDRAVQDLGLGAYANILNLEKLKEFVDTNVFPQRGDAFEAPELEGEENTEAIEPGLFGVEAIIASVPIVYDFFIKNGQQ